MLLPTPSVNLESCSPMSIESEPLFIAGQDACKKLSCSGAFYVMLRVFSRHDLLPSLRSSWLYASTILSSNRFTSFIKSSDLSKLICSEQRSRPLATP